MKACDLHLLERLDVKDGEGAIRFKVDRSAGIFRMEVERTYAYEAQQHLRAQGPSTEPVCRTLAGVASGFASALMDEECVVVETECVAMGAPCCRVVGKPRRAWTEEEGDTLAKDHGAVPLPSALRSLSEDFARSEPEPIMPIAELERRYVIQVLERFKGNRTRTARALGIGANTLWRKLKSWGVPPARGEA